VVSLSNHEHTRSSVDRPVLSETLILRQAQDERRVEGLRTSGVLELFFAAFAAFAFLVETGCGKKGPPLPPLLKVPAAPADLVAERRGATVDLQFTIPSANTDGTRPANMAHVDVYAITGPLSMTDDQILKYGASVATLAVKAPRDPDLAVEPDDPDATIEPPEGEGLDQGALAHAVEQLTPEMVVPFDPERVLKRRRQPTAPDDTPRPLLGPTSTVPSRTYVVVGTSARGRKGPLSRRVVAPLLAPPGPPAAPAVTYDEKAVTLAWAPATIAGIVQQPAAGDVLPAKPIGMPLPTLGYHVYDVSLSEPKPEAEPAATFTPEPPGTSIKLTRAPIAETTFADTRMTWGQRRCYVIRAVETIDNLTIESDATPPECRTLTDTFAPAAPKNLQTVPTDGAIDLIWDASPEGDLAGYLVLRRLASETAFEPLTPAPIQDSRFSDKVPAGVRYAYVVRAVDKAGNVGAASDPVEETAR
jgi:hypothetical protein